jgi:hypothetical protein
VILRSASHPVRIKEDRGTSLRFALRSCLECSRPAKNKRGRMATCQRCGTSLGLVARFTGRTVCPGCAARPALQQEVALVALEGRLSQVADGSIDDEGLAQIPLLMARSQLSAEQLGPMRHTALRAFIDRILADDVITDEEEARANRIIDALQIEETDFNTNLIDVNARFIVARANDNRLPELESVSAILLRPGEIGHFVVSPTALTKTTVIRERVGSSSGVSVRLMRGVRFRVGQSRGHTVEVGEARDIGDIGTLVVTSERVVYLGGKGTIDLPLRRLVAINVDGPWLQIHASNRKPLEFFVPEGLSFAVGAVLNTASQRLLT